MRIVAKELDEHIALNTQQHLRLVAMHFHGQEVNKDGRNGGGVQELGAAHQHVQRAREWEEISGRRSPYGGTLCIIIIVALMALSTIYNLHYSVNKDELTILKTEIDALSLKLCLLEYKKGGSGPEFGDHVCALEENIKDSEYCSSLMTKQFIERSEFDDRIHAVKENVENSNDFEERISAIENMSKNKDLQTPTTYRTLPFEIKVPISLGNNKEWYRLRRDPTWHAGMRVHVFRHAYTCMASLASSWPTTPN